MSSPIGRPPATGGIGSARESAREDAREVERGGRRRDGVGREPADGGDRVTLSPQALRGPAGGAEEASGERGPASGESGEAAATGFRDVGEALLAARGLAFALRADPAAAGRAHDLVSPARALALLRS